MAKNATGRVASAPVSALADASADEAAVIEVPLSATVAVIVDVGQPKPPSPGPVSDLPIGRNHLRVTPKPAAEDSSTRGNGILLALRWKYEDDDRYSRKRVARCYALHARDHQA